MQTYVIFVLYREDMFRAPGQQSRETLTAGVTRTLEELGLWGAVKHLTLALEGNTCDDQTLTYQ